MTDLLPCTCPSSLDDQGEVEKCTAERVEKYTAERVEKYTAKRVEKYTAERVQKYTAERTRGSGEHHLQLPRLPGNHAEFHRFWFSTRKLYGNKRSPTTVMPCPAIMENMVERQGEWRIFAGFSTDDFLKVRRVNVLVKET